MAGLAAHICITMGWDNDSGMLADDEQVRRTKTLLFWHVYSLERGLSIRLGRASAIHDFDITLSGRLSELSLPEPWPGMLSFWVGNAKIQGKLYEHLYSRVALSTPENVLLARAENLMKELKSLGLQNSYVRHLLTLLRYLHLLFSSNVYHYREGVSPEQKK